MDATSKAISTTTGPRGSVALHGVLAGLVSGLLLVLSFPPTGWGWLAIFVPLAPSIFALLVARRGLKPLWPAVCVGLGALPAWLWLHRFMWAITGPGFPAHGLYMAVYPVLYVWLLARLARRSEQLAWLIGVPVFWVGLEFLRGEIAINGYPWCLLGHPLIDFVPAKKIGAVFGVYGVSMLVLLVVPLQSSVRALLDRHKGVPHAPSAAPLAVIGMVAILLGVGYFTSTDPGPGTVKLRLAAIQTNLPQSNKMAWKPQQQFDDFESWRALTNNAAAAHPTPDMIVWPETMFPGAGLDPASLQAQMENLRAQGKQGSTDAMVYANALLHDQEAHGVPLLMGAVTFDGLRFELGADGKRTPRFDGKFNSAVLMRAGGIEPARYNKMHLTPFGEQVPLVWRWPKLQQVVVGLGASGMAFDLKAGQVPRVFTVAGHGPSGQTVPVRFVTPICYEATFSETSRALVYQDGVRAADIMVNISNDGWFGSQPGARETHLLVGRWRCVELGVPMFRSVNTGVSAAIDSDGKLLVSGVDGRTEKAWVDGILTHEFLIDPNNSGTIFGRIGNVFGWVVFVAACVLGLATFLPQRKAT